MHRPLLIVSLALAVVAGCGHVAGEDQATPTTIGRASEATPTTATMAASGVTTAPAPTTTPPTRVTATTAHAAASTVRPATTTTARPLTRAEATSRLCTAVAEADGRIQGGNFVGGGLRLSGAIAAYERVADVAVVSAARSMLSAGLNGDAESYATARTAASTACTRAGYPIQLSGPIMCIQAPCP